MGMVTAILTSMATNSRKQKIRRRAYLRRAWRPRARSNAQECVGSNGKIVIHPECSVLVISNKCHRVNICWDATSEKVKDSHNLFRV
jgi:hypothetical protein